LAFSKRLYDKIVKLGGSVEADDLFTHFPDQNADGMVDALQDLVGKGMIDWEQIEDKDVVVINEGAAIGKQNPPIITDDETRTSTEVQEKILDHMAGKDLFTYTELMDMLQTEGIEFDDVVVMNTLEWMENQGELQSEKNQDEKMWRVVQVAQPVGKSAEKIKIVKRVKFTKLDEKHRVVLGEVYTPAVKKGDQDCQDDWMDEEEITKMAYGFMEKSRQVGKNHIEMLGGKAVIVESFIAGEGWEPFQKGAWVLGTKIKDDKLWKDVKSGKITGYSIGGDGIRVPAEIPVAKSKTKRIGKDATLESYGYEPEMIEGHEVYVFLDPEGSGDKWTIIIDGAIFGMNDRPFHPQAGISQFAGMVSEGNISSKFLESQEQKSWADLPEAVQDAARSRWQSEKIGKLEDAYTYDEWVQHEADQIIEEAKRQQPEAQGEPLVIHMDGVATDWWDTHATENQDIEDKEKLFDDVIAALEAKGIQGDRQGTVNEYYFQVEGRTEVEKP